jgi:biopolymer transport protein ExbD
VQFQRSGAQQPTINIAPLVDVVFLLVIFFAVSTTFLETAGLELELPTSTSTAQREPKEITVFLESDGSVMLGDERLEAQELAPRLRAELEQAERKIVVLRADTKTSHGEVVKIMDLIRDAGAEGLTVAARSAPE